MLMNRTNRITIALREKFPGDETEEGINFSHAADAIGVSRQTLINWLRKPNVEIKTSNWNALASATGYNRHWLELEEGQEKPGNYQRQTKNANQAVNEARLSSCPNIQYFKWSQLRNVLDKPQRNDINSMTNGKTEHASQLAIELETNQFAPYAVAGESILVQPGGATHSMKILAEIEGEYYILHHDKLLNRFSDVHGNQIDLVNPPRIIGTIIKIFGASRDG